MRLAPAVARLLRIVTERRATAFDRALHDPRAAQARTLAQIIGLCARTDYARALGLSPGMDVDEYRARTPIVDYSAVRPWIARQRDGGACALAPGRVRSYEPTSGSADAVKHIPYNDALLGSFRALFAIWLHDLLVNVLRPRSGRTFISVSSPVRADGFTDDTEYLSRPLRALLARFLIMPRRIGRAGADAWRDALAAALASSDDLEVISVWNPSYLVILLDHLEARRDRILTALPPARRALFANRTLRWPEIWPSLQLISCWTDATAAVPASRLAALFPGVAIQGKGLIATEAPVTVPLARADGCAPLVDEVFLEFEDSEGRPRLLHEATPGAEYSLIVSQAGGLLRYRLGDRVRVTGHYHATPLLTFCGRADDVIDLVGEKLSERFVASALHRLAGAGTFCTVLPVMPEEGRPHYWLLTDDPRPDLASAFEAALQQAFRYREARELGQLDAVTTLSRPEMRRVVHDALGASGMRAGDIKDRALITSPDLARRLRSQLAEVQAAT